MVAAFCIEILLLLFFILYLGFALVFLWLGSLLIFCGAKLFKSPETARPAGKMFSRLSGFGLVTGAIFYFYSHPRATVIYKNQFGESPTSDVQNLQGSSPGFFHELTLLRFQAAPSTTVRLVRIQKLRLSARASFDASIFVGFRAPAWWSPHPRTRVQLYADLTGRDNKSLLYEPQTQTAWYVHSLSRYND